MSKVKQTEETVDDVFEGFNFLDGPVPKEAKKIPKEAKKEVVENDDLSEEDIKALEAAEKEIKSTKKKEVKEVDDEEEVEQPEKQIEEQEDTTNPFEAFTSFLSEEGIIELEEEDKVESEKDLAKVVSKNIKKGIAQDRAKLPEDAQKFLEFVDNGGKPADFHKYYYSEASFEDFDITDDDNKKYVIREALKLEEYTDEEIQEELDLYEDSGKLDKKAETYLKKLQKIEKQNKDLLLETQKAYAKEQEALRNKEWEEFRKGLFDKDEIGGFKMTPKMKEDTWNYMTKVVDKKTGETQYQKDSKENTDARYIFAYLLKNKWDIKALEKQVETKQVSKLKEKLSNFSDTRGKLKSPIKHEKEEDGDNPFEAFKKVLK